MAGMIPPEIVDQVRHATDIVDVIGSYVPLKKAGAKYKALSPFNKEKTPSFFVDPGRQMFKCFSSGHGGDVFKFLMVHDHMTFPEAVRRLAQKAGVNIPENGPVDPAARGRREELLALHAAVATWWQKLLHSDPAAQSARIYLQAREIDSALADEFGLGFAPHSWDATSTWAREAGYSTQALETARLVATNEAGRTYDFFRGRLMIPIHNEAGEVVAFSGRLLDPEAKAQKYVNSPETPIFSKSRILFGLHKTKRAIIEADSAILCEGQIDLMRCWQKGICNVVAPQGTAFTDQQARTLKRLAKEVIICFDADNAGQNAAQRCIDILLKEDVQVRLARIPAGEDPDSLLRKRPVEDFQVILGEAKDYTRHLLEIACAQEDISSPRGRGLVAQRMAQVLARIPNAVQREAFLLEVAGRLQVSRAGIEEEMRKAEAQLRRAASSSAASSAAGSGDPAESPGAEAPSLEPLHPDRLVEALISLLMHHPAFASEVSRRLNPTWLDDLEGGEVVRHILDAHAHDAWEDAPHYLETCDERTRDYLTGLLVGGEHAPDEADVTTLAGKLLDQLEARARQQHLQRLEQSVKSGLLAPSEVMATLTEIQAIRRGAGPMTI